MQAYPAFLGKDGAGEILQLFQDDALVVDPHVAVAMELDADRTFRLGR